MGDRCSWIDSQGRACPAPGTVKKGGRCFCYQHSDCHSQRRGDRITEDLLNHEVPKPENIADRVAALAGQGPVIDMARVARAKARKVAARVELACAIYSEAMSGCLEAGLAIDEAHKQAIAEVYLRGEYSVIDPKRFDQATPFGAPGNKQPTSKGAK